MMRKKELRAALQAKDRLLVEKDLEIYNLQVLVTDLRMKVIEASAYVVRATRR